MPAVWGGLVRMAPRNGKFPTPWLDGRTLKCNLILNVIGAIDCTCVAIRAPSENEFADINRKLLYCAACYVLHGLPHGFLHAFLHSYLKERCCVLTRRTRPSSRSQRLWDSSAASVSSRLTDWLTLTLSGDASVHFHIFCQNK